MASADPETHDRAMRRYVPPRGGVPGRRRVRGRERGGGDRVQPRPAGPGARPAAAHALRRPAAPRRAVPDPVLERPARDATLLLDEPTNHLDADSIVWLRDYLKTYKGGLVVISHDVGLLEHAVTRVFHLDANRAEIDVYNVGWKAYLHPARDRRAAPQAGARERREAGLGPQGAGRPDALQGDQGARRAEHGQARRPSCWPAWRRSGATTGSPSCASRSPRRAARPR